LLCKGKGRAFFFARGERGELKEHSEPVVPEEDPQEGASERTRGKEKSNLFIFLEKKLSVLPGGKSYSQEEKKKRCMFEVASSNQKLSVKGKGAEGSEFAKLFGRKKNLSLPGSEVNQRKT